MSKTAQQLRLEVPPSAHSPPAPLVREGPTHSLLRSCQLLDADPPSHGSPASPTPCVLLSRPHQSQGPAEGAERHPVSVWGTGVNTLKVGALCQAQEQTSESRSKRSLVCLPPPTQAPQLERELFP